HRAGNDRRDPDDHRDHRGRPVTDVPDAHQDQPRPLHAPSDRLLRLRLGPAADLVRRLSLRAVPLMTPLVTLVDPIVSRPPDPDEVDPEDAFAGALLAGFDLAGAGTIAAYAAHLPVAVGDDDRPLG